MKDVTESVEMLKASLMRWPESERLQILLQIEAILAAKDNSDQAASDLIDAFGCGLLRASRSVAGEIVLTLTEKGEASAAALIKEMAGHKSN